MELSQRKEQYSAAFLRAIASIAGYGLAEPKLDDDSIDWVISGRSANGLISRPRLEVQLKYSAQSLLKEEHLHFPLDLKNYNDLRLSEQELLAPRLLIVMLVPQNISEWLAQSETENTLKQCAYWMSLQGMEPTTNATNVMVRLPRKQLFTASSLSDIMERISRKESS